MMRSFGPEVDCYVVTPVCNETAWTSDQAVHSSNRIHLVPLRSGEYAQQPPLTRWTQDVVHAFSGRTSSGNVRLELQYNTQRVDAAPFRELQKYIPGLSYRPSSENGISGGNILIGENGNFLVAGADLLHWYCLGYSGTERVKARREAEDGLRRKFGVEGVYWVNSTKASGRLNGGQPLFHLDMYVTLAGRDRETGRELVLVGEVADDYVFCRQPEETKALKESLDRTAAWFENTRNHPGLNCRVVRIPLLVFDCRRGRFGSYNNCLVESSGSKRVFYFPDLTPENLTEVGNSERMRRIITIQENLTAVLRQQQAGTARFVSGGFYGLSEKMGALRCRIKVIQRTDV